MDVRVSGYRYWRIGFVVDIGILQHITLAQSLSSYQSHHTLLTNTHPALSCIRIYCKQFFCWRALKNLGVTEVPSHVVRPMDNTENAQQGPSKLLC